MLLTKRQTLFLVVICLLASKVQRLPSLISTDLGRHGYFVFLIMGMIDFVMLLLCLGFNKLAGKTTTYELTQKTGGAFYSKLIFLLFAIYFLFNSILPYEAVHDLFGNILFDHLSWPLYSVVLGLTIFFIASKGLKNMGRLAEVFFYIIVLSFLMLLILGASTSNLRLTLPVCDIDGELLVQICFKYNIWFGDFIIIYMFVGKIKQDDGSLGWPVAVAILVATLVLTFAYMVFYGLYQEISGEQNSLISAISQFALLGLDIGRVDWFLVLFFQFAAVISSSTYLLLASKCFLAVFLGEEKASDKADIKRKKLVCFYVVLTLLTALIYFLDIFIFKSNQEGVALMASFTKWLGVAVVFVLPVILLITASVFAKKRKKQEKNLQNRFKNLSFLKNSKKTTKASVLLEKKLRKLEGGEK